MALTLAIPLTWAIAACLREPELWGHLFYGQHLERAVTAKAHPGPPWCHLIHVIHLWLPWTPSSS
ncbi:MAG: hypothetical protein R3F17_06535 [Planctomycetota bacterium]